MHYVSTRNIRQNFSFREVFLNGLASDGGLYIPKDIPFYLNNNLQDLKGLTYEQLAAEIILKFCSSEFSEAEIIALVKKSYKNFRTKEVVSFRKIKNTCASKIMLLLLLLFENER